MKCPKCEKPHPIIVQYYYSDGTRAFTSITLGDVATLCGPKPAIWEKTEYICSRHGIVLKTLDNTMTLVA